MFWPLDRKLAIDFFDEGSLLVRPASSSWMDSNLYNNHLCGVDIGRGEYVWLVRFFPTSSWVLLILHSAPDYMATYLDSGGGERSSS